MTERVLWQITEIASNIQYTLIFATISIFMASVAVFLNHYSWNRAKILTLLTVEGIISWIGLNIIIMGDDVDLSGNIKAMAFTILLGVYIIIGYWIGGLFKQLMAEPINIHKLRLIKFLRICQRNVSGAVYSVGLALTNLTSSIFNEIATVVENTLDDPMELEKKKTIETVEQVLKNNIHLL